MSHALVIQRSFGVFFSHSAPPILQVRSVFVVRRASARLHAGTIVNRLSVDSNPSSVIIFVSQSSLLTLHRSTQAVRKQASSQLQNYLLQGEVAPLCSGPPHMPPPRRHTEHHRISDRCWLRRRHHCAASVRIVVRN